MLEAGRKSAAEVARLFGVHPATVSRLAARARGRDVHARRSGPG